MDAKLFGYRVASKTMSGTAKTIRITGKVACLPAYGLSVGLIAAGVGLANATVKAEKAIDRACNSMEKLSRDLKYKGAYVRDLPVKA